MIAGSYKQRKKMFFFGAIPVIVLGHVNAFLMVDPNQAERPEFAPYDYLRIRTKVRYHTSAADT
jgi:hypothetical protein